VALRSKSKKSRLEEFLAERQPVRISEEIWRELVGLLAPISESYLRELLHRANVPVAQPFGGVRQSSFEELEASLIEMGAVYSEAVAKGELARATACRRAVIQAKDRARFVSRNPEKRKQKEEMVEWMLVWLENPGIFESWVRLRKKA